MPCHLTETETVPILMRSPTCLRYSLPCSICPGLHLIPYPQNHLHLQQLPILRIPLSLQQLPDPRILMHLHQIPNPKILQYPGKKLHLPVTLPWNPSSVLCFLPRKKKAIKDLRRLFHPMPNKTWMTDQRLHQIDPHKRDFLQKLVFEMQELTLAQACSAQPLLPALHVSPASPPHRQEAHSPPCETSPAVLLRRLFHDRAP